MTIEIRDTLAETEWPAMDDFLARAYRPSYIMRDRALFDWQFQHRTKPHLRTVVTAWHGGQIVGMLGYMPLLCHWGNCEQPVLAAWMANWMVDEDFRRGIGPLVMRRLQEIYPVLLGQGANDANKPIARRMGFQIYDRIPRQVAIFDDSRAAAFRAAETISLPPRWRPAHSFAGAREFDLAIASDIYDPDWRQYSAMAYGTQRNTQYLVWRYFNHPNFRYRTLVAGPKDCPALCVYRIEATGDAESGPVGRIVEFFHADGDESTNAGVEVLSAALHEMSDAGCAFADFYCTADLTLQTATLVGMTEATNLQLASRLSPLDPRWHPQNLEIWASGSLHQAPSLNKLYITKSDGDQDRPNRA